MSFLVIKDETLWENTFDSNLRKTVFRTFFEPEMLLCLVTQCLFIFNLYLFIEMAFLCNL